MYKDIIRPTLVLIIIAAVISAMLALAYNLTGIADLGTGIDDKDLQSYVSTVLPKGTKLEKAKTSIEDTTILGIYIDEGGAGCAVHLIAKGYGGEMKVLIGLDMNGAFTGAKIIESKETPGLGTQIEEPSFINKYIGKTNSVALIKDDGEIDGIAGATISSRAFTTAVNKAFEVFALVKGEL